jgi:hypothetical protein
VPGPVASFDEVRRPIVTLEVQPSDVSPFPKQLVCHIDTGADASIVFRSYQKALEFGLCISDRSAFVEDPESGHELADGTVVNYLVDFLFITEWINGRSRWAKVLVPPPPSAGPGENRRPSEEKSQYRRPDALLGLDLLRSAQFRLCDSRGLVELLPVD